MIMKSGKKVLVSGVLALSLGILATSHAQMNARPAQGDTADTYASYAGPLVHPGDVDPSPQFLGKIWGWVKRHVRIAGAQRLTSCEATSALAMSDAAFDINPPKLAAR
jgi:hypothetical protein